VVSVRGSVGLFLDDEAFGTRNCSNASWLAAMDPSGATALSTTVSCTASEFGSVGASPVRVVTCTPKRNFISGRSAMCSASLKLSRLSASSSAAHSTLKHWSGSGTVSGTVSLSRNTSSTPMFERSLATAPC
jgi:hypothetical protein